MLKFQALESGALILPLIIFTSIWSIAAGQIMARMGRYFAPVISGFTIWTVGAGLKCLFTLNTPLWTIILVLLVEGSGIGLILQPSKSYTPIYALARDWRLVSPECFSLNSV